MLTIWIARDKNDESLWIHTKEPKLDKGGEWISSPRHCYIVANLKEGQKQRIKLNLKDI